MGGQFGSFVAHAHVHVSLGGGFRIVRRIGTPSRGRDIAFRSVLDEILVAIPVSQRGGVIAVR